MTAFARSERLALCETLRAVGPDAPTLCEGWLTRDLAAHLVLRESRPDAAPGIVVSALAGSVTLTGRAGELLFYAFGRTDHARVEIDGEPQDVTAFQTVHVGL